MAERTPQRVRRSRAKGARMTEGAVYVGRPTKWGNPFPWQGTWITWTAVALGHKADAAGRRATAVALYEAWVRGTAATPGPLAASTEGGTIEFTGGAVVTVNDHVRGIAAVAAGLCEQPTPQAPPSVDGLRGKDLACWCPLDQPCHADVLLAVANA